MGVRTSALSLTLCFNFRFSIGRFDLGERKRKPSENPPKNRVWFVAMSMMDFQVVVLGGGVSKKLLPLVSKVHSFLFLLILLFGLKCECECEFPFTHCLRFAGAPKRFTSGGEPPGSLLRSRALGA